MLRLAAVILSALSPLAAQGRTFIVDQANGPGTDFLDLPPAVAAAGDGDIIRMRPGEYSGVTTAKALTVVGPATASIGTNATGPLTIEGLPAGREFSVQGVTLRSFFFAATAHDCRGRVFFDRVRLLAQGGLSSSWSGLMVRECAHVQLTGCDVRGRSGIQSINSLVVISDSTVAASDANTFQMQLPSPGLSGVNSTFHVSRCNIVGGNDLNSLPTPAAPGISVRSSNLIVAGDTTSTVQAGTSSGGEPVSAIHLVDNSSLTVDPAVRVIPTNGAPPILGAMVTTRRLAALQVRGAPIGGTVSTDVYSPQGDLVIFAVGLPGDPVSVPFLGGFFYLDLTTPLITLPPGVQGPSEHFSFSYVQPNNPSLVARRFTYQYLCGTAANGFQLSNPATVVVE